MMWQEWAVAIVVAGAVCYAGYRTYIAIRRSNDPCYGCKGCALKDPKRQQMKKNGCCCHKK